ncbi:MAG: hypothetical protein ACRDQA_30820 [Nocardioidaceae bacterium]
MSAVIETAVDEAVGELVPLVGVKAACDAVGVPRASYYQTNPVGGTGRARSRAAAAGHACCAGAATGVERGRAGWGALGAAL